MSKLKEFLDNIFLTPVYSIAKHHENRVALYKKTCVHDDEDYAEPKYFKDWIDAYEYMIDDFKSELHDYIENCLKAFWIASSEPYCDIYNNQLYNQIHRDLMPIVYTRYDFTSWNGPLEDIESFFKDFFLPDFKEYVLSLIKHENNKLKQLQSS